MASDRSDLEWGLDRVRASTIKSVLDRALPLAQASEAHKLVAANNKVADSLVLTPLGCISTMATGPGENRSRPCGTLEIHVYWGNRCARLWNFNNRVRMIRLSESNANHDCLRHRRC